VKGGTIHCRICVAYCSFSADPYGTCGQCNKNWCQATGSPDSARQARDVLLIEPDQSSDSLRGWSRARSALEVLVTLLRR
jgi:hypothetical protein